MIATKQLPVEVLQELTNEFAAGLAARAAVMREAVDEIVRGPSADAAHRLRLTAHALAGTAASFGAPELVPHAERLESLGREWQDGNGSATKASVTDAWRALDLLNSAVAVVTARLRTR
jgi:HPt (histidine-containing phosphotransfer) domain-containing protein